MITLSQQELNEIDKKLKETELRILRDLIAKSDNENIVDLLNQLLMVAKIIYAAELDQMLSSARRNLINEYEQEKMRREIESDPNTIWFSKGEAIKHSSTKNNNINNKKWNKSGFKIFKDISPKIR